MLEAVGVTALVLLVAASAAIGIGVAVLLWLLIWGVLRNV